ncbi:hypothetical protein OC835_005238 [Tilletia horrida]|nr:hypothetical protein OC835_005238 [Tilletia horrida]
MDGDDGLLALLHLDDGDGEGPRTHTAPTASSTAGAATATAQETPREARVRRAIEAAKRSFVPVREDNSWFLSAELRALLDVRIVQPPPPPASSTGIKDDEDEDEWTDCEQVQIEHGSLDDFLIAQLRVDKRASNKLDWSLSALYGNDCTRAALTLALALLRTCHWDITLAALHSLPSTSSSSSADLSTWTLPPAPIENDLMSTARKGKGRAATLEPAFGFGKEALDVAIRSISRLLHLQDASAQLRPLALLLASRALQQLPHEGLRESVWDGEREIEGGWQTVHWTNTPGLSLSLGHLCAQLEHWRAATSAYALYIGTRGPLRIPSRHLALSLAHLALTTPAEEEARKACTLLARAFAASYISATPAGAARQDAIADIAQSQLFTPQAQEDGHGRGDEGRQDPEAHTFVPLLPPEAAVALLRCGPARKGALTLVECASRLGKLLSGSADGADEVMEEDERVQIRSVRTL